MKGNGKQKEKGRKEKKPCNRKHKKEQPMDTMRITKIQYRTSHGYYMSNQEYIMEYPMNCT